MSGDVAERGSTHEVTMARDPLRILFVMTSLRLGGAERVASQLTQLWAQSGHEVHLITFDDTPHDHFPLGSKVHRHVVGVFSTLGQPVYRKIWQNALRFWRLRRLIKEIYRGSPHLPTVVVSFLDVPNMVTLTATMGLGLPVVISERTYPPYFHHPPFYDGLRKRLYRRAAAFVAQTQLVAAWGAGFLSRKTVIDIIPNPLALTASTPGRALDQGASRHHKVVGVGRLDPQKGFDLLIRAWSELAATHPQWCLDIVGDGPQRDLLQSLIDDANLSERVRLVGVTKDPGKYYQQADIFVLSSRIEGFPNALLEAMATGLAVVSFDCKSGPRDLLEDGVNGLLVPPEDVQGLSRAVASLMDDATLCHRLGERAQATASAYSGPMIADKWIQMFRSILGGAGDLSAVRGRKEVSDNDPR